MLSLNIFFIFFIISRRRCCFGSVTALLVFFALLLALFDVRAIVLFPLLVVRVMTIFLHNIVNQEVYSYDTYRQTSCHDQYLYCIM